MEMVGRKSRPPAKSLPSRAGRAFQKFPHRSGIVVTVLFKGEKGFFLGTPSKGKTKARGPSSRPRARSVNPMVSKMRHDKKRLSAAFRNYGLLSGRSHEVIPSRCPEAQRSCAQLRVPDPGAPGAPASRDPFPGDPGIRGPLHPRRLRCPSSPCSPS
jgi:hypothetical protein